MCLIGPHTATKPNLIGQWVLSLQFLFYLWFQHKWKPSSTKWHFQWISIMLNHNNEVEFELSWLKSQVQIFLLWHCIAVLGKTGVSNNECISTYSCDHAVIFFDGPTATKETNNGHNHTNNNQEHWCWSKVRTLGNFQEVAIFFLNQSTNDNECKAT